MMVSGCRKCGAELKKYLWSTMVGQLVIIAVISPWLFLAVGMTMDQYFVWLWQGSLIAFVLPYAIVRVTSWSYQKVFKSKL